MAGLFVAPVVPPIFVVVLEQPAALSDVPWLAAGAGAIYLISLALGSIVGLPIFYLLASLGLLSWWAFPLGGLAVGAIIGFLFGLLGLSAWRAYILFACEGILSAAVFWLFWKMGPAPNADNARRWVRAFIRRKYITGVRQ
jgi:hypothetical protein